MANNIKGNQDGENGRNESYRILGRTSKISRKRLVKEVEKGIHPKFSIYERNREKYVRAKADHSVGNNVDEM